MVPAIALCAVICHEESLAESMQVPGNVQEDVNLQLPKCLREPDTEQVDIEVTEEGQMATSPESLHYDPKDQLEQVDVLYCPG